MRHAFRAFLAVCIMALAAAAPAYAKVRIDLSAPGAAPLPIAVPDFHGDTPDAARFGADLAGVIRGDLGNSTPFKVLNPASYLQTPAQMAATGPLFADWRALTPTLWSTPWSSRWKAVKSA